MQNAPSVLSPRGEAAVTLANLGELLIIMGAAVFVIVSLLVLVGALRRKGNLAEHAPVNAGGGVRWIQLGGLVFPTIILTVAFLATLSTLGRFAPGGNGGADHGIVPAAHAAVTAFQTPADSFPSIRVTGEQWWWDVEYRFPGSTRSFTTANEIHVPVGRTVSVEITSKDVIHSFWIPQLHPKIDAIPGRTNLLRIEAREAGTYRGECAEYCGDQHAHMAFVVVAEREDQYRRWLGQQQMTARPPGDPVAAHGEQIFLREACAFCHSIRGTGAHGTVAPDLTHLASRHTIAAGLLPNNRGNLQAWVVGAPSLKPGTRMPAMAKFDGKDLNALVSYLESLQ